MSTNSSHAPGLRVGGVSEPDGTQPMSPTQEDVAAWLGVAERTVRRWEAGTAQVPDGVRAQLEDREQLLVEQAERVVAQLRDAADVVLGVPREGAPPDTAAYWRAVAYRVSEAVPGLYVTYVEG